MADILTPRQLPPTLAEVVERLGSIPLERIPWFPGQGTVTEEDVLRRPAAVVEPADPLGRLP